jgi:hypothetical protein
LEVEVFAFEVGLGGEGEWECDDLDALEGFEAGAERAAEEGAAGAAGAGDLTPNSAIDANK